MRKVSHIYFELTGYDKFIIKYNKDKPAISVPIGTEQTFRKEDNNYIFQFMDDQDRSWSIVIDSSGNKITSFGKYGITNTVDVEPENMKLLIEYFYDVNVADWF